MRVTVHLVQAFLENGSGGNGAGVVLDAAELTREEKQAVAADIALSETAFVSPGKRAPFRIEFFTPRRQVPHCGHATTAAFTVLQEEGRLTCSTTAKETVEDVRKILLRDGMVFQEQKAPRFGPAVSALRAADPLGAPAGVVLDAEGVDTGNAWLVVTLRDETALAALRPDPEALTALCREAGALGAYAVAPSPAGAGSDLGARMFAPGVGIPEESATGSAAGPAACLWHRRQGGSTRLVIRQGHLMDPPSPSRLEVRLNVAEGRIRNLLVGGAARVVGQRTVVL